MRPAQTILIVLLTAACFAPAFAATPERPALDPAILERVRRPIVYRVPRMEDVKVLANLRYSSIDEPRLRMDVYLPPEPAGEKRRPVVLLLHGGAPAGIPVKDAGAFRSWGRVIAAQGMVAVVAGHRLEWPLARLEEAAADVVTALDYVRTKSGEWQADADRICVAAWSAGGPLLSVALREPRPYIRCQLGIYPLIDIRPPEPASASALQRQYSLSTYLKEPAFPPLFVARAGRDAIPELNERLDRFVADAVAANVPLTFVNHPQGLHGFDVDNDDERSREIIRAALEFMHVHLFAAAAD
ncbi:acetyl esterase/lipase [Povalibacter uvarum]|uniref:Acetyl esterase/lipase n=1 Tax=Povalibacter uvarum TaxID=732238 RepID=A0A841HT57_9GAMM|nr:alpha/beta hydrolase [Povalibacter uvarum]MBB6096527.1 acetyl esterase/lipase [Povalibacter uvarum]